MTPLEDLLSQALLVRDRTVPATSSPSSPTRRPAPPTPHQGLRPPGREDLRALCETLVPTPPPPSPGSSPTSSPNRAAPWSWPASCNWPTPTTPARFWWQYAAGAGQSAAAYCLYLHHLSLGETDTARWWHSQMDTTAAAPTADHGERLDAASTTTMLRVLHHLARHTTRQHSTTVTRLMTYMPTAVATGYLREPDMELPLPGPDFARTVRALLTAARAHPSATPAPSGPFAAPGTHRPKTTQRQTPKRQTIYSVRRARPHTTD
ncbi:hypothetical protein [Streptomyces sp. N1]|uniref:hypothetical protein n=1 Tax=Streptomyces sp. N1 TaxID=576456 RepID=UPI0010105A91|nr:hypothetical protein [Streptomyces sp. N1]